MSPQELEELVAVLAVLVLVSCPPR